MDTILNFLKKKGVYATLIVVMVTIGLFFYATRTKSPPTSVTKVTRGPITEEVTVTGTVKPKEAVVLAFEKTGKVRKINVEVGDMVAQGDLLMALENGVEISSVEDAEA